MSGGFAVYGSDGRNHLIGETEDSVLMIVIIPNNNNTAAQLRGNSGSELRVIPKSAQEDQLCSGIKLSILHAKYVLSLHWALSGSKLVFQDPLE